MKKPRSAKVWFPLFPADFMADTATLSPECVGAYLLLLMYSWRTGRLPDDDVELAQLARMSLTRWQRRVAPRIRRFFDAHDGILSNARLEKEREIAAKNSQQKKSAAHEKWRQKRGLESNNNNEMTDAHASEPHMQKVCPSPSPSPSPIKKVKEREINLPPVNEPELADDAEEVAVQPSQADLLNNVTRLPDPVPEAVRLWNAMAAGCGLSVVQKITQPRRAAMAGRLKDCGGLDGWKHALELVSTSPFLLGQVNDFKADFDFVTRPAKFTKLMEGGYNNSGKGRAAKPSATDSWADLRRELREEGTFG